MTLIFRDGFSTVNSTYTFETTAGQFGTDQDRLEYSQFFGLGGGEDDPFVVPFDLPLDLSVNLPFAGEVELFSARIFGDLAATFGLQVTAAANNGAPDPDDPTAPPTGTISASLPYQLSYAFPTLDAVEDAGELITLHLGNSFTADDTAGFTTLFPRLEFNLDLVAALSADIAAEVGRGESTKEFTVLDFSAGTSYELFSLDTGRRDAEGEKDPINALGGTTTQEIIEDIEWLDPVYDREDEFAGVEIPFNQFFSNPETKDKEKADAEVEGQTEPDNEDPEAEEEESDPPDPAGLDLGSLQILVPNINATSKYVDGVFITDPSKRVVDGEIIDDLDADGFPQERGNKGDIAVLTVDVDGLVTYATGGTFPPLEFAFERIEHSIADVLTLTADFYYNLFDVELVASLPLVQDFTLTPDLATRLNFFEVNGDGSKGAAKTVEVVQLEQVLLFDENGSFQSEAVADRLAELSETSSLRVAQDVAQFVDFDAGTPGAFTGQTGSIGGRVVVREGDGPWRELFTNADDPIASSAPALGQNQLAPLDVSTLDFGYKIFRDDLAIGDFEIVEFEFDEADSIFRLETRETVSPISQTPYLVDFDALDLRYDGDDTFVEVEYRAQPFIHNRTGLDFDLELVLSAMEFYAEFGAFVDLGFTELGGTIEFDFGPLWRERFPLFEASLVDFYNDGFQAVDEDSYTESFVLGAPAPDQDFGDAIVGTEGDDLLRATPEGSSIVTLGGNDTVTGGAGDDTIFIGAGATTINGAGGYDTLDLGLIETPIITNEARVDFGQRIGVAYRVSTIEELPEFGAHRLSRRDENGGRLDEAGDDIHIRGIEEVLFTDAADELLVQVAGTTPPFLVPMKYDLRGGNDRVVIDLALAALEARGLEIDAGDGDDRVGIFTDAAQGTDWSNIVVDGGAGVNTLELNSDFDLSRPVGEQGLLGARITGFANLSAIAGFITEILPEEEGGGVRAVPNLYRLAGDDQENRIEGERFDDTLSGGGGNDKLIGGEGDDILSGDAGADDLRGGAGVDTASYGAAATSVFIDLDFDGDGIGRGFRGEAQGDALTGIENLAGSAFDDILIGAEDDANSLSGNDGDDRLMAKGYRDTLLGGAGDDLLAAGGTVRSFTSMNNEYDGGAGFDFLALQTFDPVRVTGTASATARYTYLEGNKSFNDPTSSTRSVTVDYRYDITGHVRATLDEDGSGTVEYWTDTVVPLATGLSGTAAYSATNSNLIFSPYNVKTSSFDYGITATAFSNLTGRSISFSKSGDNNNGSGSIITPPAEPSGTRGGLYDTESFTGIEGLIGTAGDDFLTGNSDANALYGNGGWDLLRGGGDGNLLGFGEGQKLRDIFSFPGQSGGGAPVQRFFTMEEQLVAANPYGTEAPLGMPVGRIRIGDSTQSNRTEVVGSMLWGQGQDNTVDMRFDRGISFLPDRSENYAFVDLNIAGDSAPTNDFTGEAVMYGRAEWRSETGTVLSFAHTFGVHNIIGSQNGDLLRGDRADNVIEGMGGADLLYGFEGTDTLAYGRAPDGVTLNMADDGEGGLILDNTQAEAPGRGHAERDLGVGFERFTLSDHDDEVLIDVGIPVRIVNLAFDDGRRAVLPVAELPDNDPLRFDLGDGADHLTLVGGPRVLADLGAGHDTAHVAGPGHVLLAGEGDDRITLADPGQASLSNFDAAARTTMIDGGAGADTVVLEGDRFTRVTITETGALVEQNPLTELEGDATEAEKAQYTDGARQSPPIIYDLRDVEFIEMNGARLRLDPQEPDTGADRTRMMVEDARAPFALDASATQPELEANTVFRVVALPEGALVLRPDGAALAVGDRFAAATLEELRALAGQDYTQAPQSFVYAEDVADAPERTVPLPEVPPIPGIALGITAPVDPLEAPLDITVTELPDHGVIFYRAPQPDLAERGLLVMTDVAVALGDMLTPDQLEGLHYQAGLDRSGPAGAFAYEASHGEGITALGGVPVRLAGGLDPDAFDGRESQRIEIEILPVDDAPRISRLLFPMSPGGTLEGTIGATDPEGDAFAIELVGAPGLGTLSLSPDGSFTYVQNAPIDFAGAEFVEETFTVRAVQEDGLASVARTETIRIIDPDFVKPIVFDVSREDVFFEDDGTPVKLGGLGTDDRIIGAFVVDNELFGFGGNDILRGIGGNNRLDGGEGHDTIYGADGSDTLIGGDGHDRLTGGETEADLRDVVFAGDGDDAVDGGHGNDELNGMAGNDTMEGGFGVDRLVGGDGDDVLTGSAFSDQIFGNDGFDFINGGFGSDRVNGGAGADRFFHVGNAGHGSDWIQDYSAAEGDVLVYGGTATRDQFQVNIATTMGAGDGAVDEAFVIYTPTGQILWALVDGAGEGEITLRLSGVDHDLLA